VALALVTLAGASCAPPEPQAPKAVIVMIGDGMGFPQVTFARNLLLEPGERWSFERFPVTGIVSTRSASNLTTDSGAAATAIAAGVKTENQRIGSTDQGASARSFAEAARRAGWRIGLVTTTTVTHATPAAFYAHVEDRYADVDEIGGQLLDFGADVVLGGGLGPLLPEDELGEGVDNRNLAEEAERQGYTVWTQGADRSARPDRLMGLLTEDHFTFRIDDQWNPQEDRDPPLAELTQIALDILTRDGGPFFLMVEGGRIDHACHSFDGPSAARELQDFAEAISLVREFQLANPATLVLVTADHATGGLAINDFVDWDGLRRQQASVEWMGEQIRNSGAGADLVVRMTGYEDITEEEIDVVRQEPEKYEAWRHLGRILSQRNGVTWVPRVSQNTKGHTGEDVPLYAAGLGAERFQGVLDNTEIAERVMELAGFAAPGGD
jgi:alkaline phosphatase